MTHIEQLRQLAYDGRHREARELAACEIEWLYVIDHSFRDLIAEDVLGDGFGVGHGYRGLLGSGTGDGNRRGALPARGEGSGGAFVDGSGLGTGLEEPVAHDLLQSGGFKPMDFTHIQTLVGGVLQIGGGDT